MVDDSAGEAVVGAGEVRKIGNGVAGGEDGAVLLIVIVEDQAAGGLGGFLGVAGDAASLEDGLDITGVFDVLQALLKAQAGLALGVPLSR